MLRPDINESYARFAVINGNIRFALASIKNIGEAAIEQITEERKKNGKYKSFVDFLERVQSERVNKKCIESLIKAGAFDELENDYNRFDLLANYESIIDSISSERRGNIANQVNLFDAISDTQNVVKHTILRTGTVPTKRELLDMEKEMTGLYVSGHPLDEYMEKIQKTATITTAELLEATDVSNEEEREEIDNTKYDGKEAVMCGLITNLKKIFTKSNRQMAFSEFEDIYGSIEAVFFPTIYEKNVNLINSDKVVELKGKISFKENEKPKILVDTIKELGVYSKLFVKIIEDENEDEKTRKLLEIIEAYEGEIPVYVYYEKEDKLKLIPREKWIKPTDELIQKLNLEFGEANVKLK